MGDAEARPAPAARAPGAAAAPAAGRPGALAAASVTWWLTPRDGAIYGTFVVTAGAGDPGLQEPSPWVAHVGVGALATMTHANAAAVVGKVRDMSRTAWTFPSRVSWHDQSSGRITEVPEPDTA